MSKIKLPSLLEMLQSGVHFGHRTSRWHPKMKPFIFTERNGIHIINLEKTRNYLEKALNFVYNVTAEGGEVLFVGTKKQVKDIISKVASDVDSPMVTDKWVGGLFTNFKTIYKLIKKLDKLEMQKQKGEWSRYTKKEQLDLEKEYQNLLFKVGGIRKMSRLPQAVFVVDVMQEKTAVQESKKKGIPVVAICDTNINPDKIDYPIPANDDAVKGLQLLVGLVGQAVKAGKEKYKNNPVKTEVKKETGEEAKKEQSAVKKQKVAANKK